MSTYEGLPKFVVGSPAEIHSKVDTTIIRYQEEKFFEYDNKGFELKNLQVQNYKHSQKQSSHTQVSSNQGQRYVQ